MLLTLLLGLLCCASCLPLVSVAWRLPLGFWSHPQARIGVKLAACSDVAEADVLSAVAAVTMARRTGCFFVSPMLMSAKLRLIEQGFEDDGARSSVRCCAVFRTGALSWGFVYPLWCVARVPLVSSVCTHRKQVHAKRKRDRE